MSSGRRVRFQRRLDRQDRHNIGAGSLFHQPTTLIPRLAIKDDGVVARKFDGSPAGVRGLDGRAARERSWACAFVASAGLVLTRRAPALRRCLYLVFLIPLTAPLTALTHIQFVTVALVAWLAILVRLERWPSLDGETAR